LAVSAPDIIGKWIAGLRCGKIRSSAALRA